MHVAAAIVTAVTTIVMIDFVFMGTKVRKVLEKGEKARSLEG